MLRLVRQVAVDDVHDAAEQRDAQRFALGLVRGAVPHFVQRARPSPHVEAADGPGRSLGPGGHLGHPEHRLDPERLTEVLEEPLGVRVQEERRLVAVADTGRLDLGFVDGTRPELQVLEHLVRNGELDRSGELEAIAPDELGRRGHPSDEVVLLDTQHPHAAAGHDGGGGQPVVPCSDDDRVVVRHLPEDCSDRPDCSPDCFAGGAAVRAWRGPAVGRTGAASGDLGPFRRLPPSLCGPRSVSLMPSGPRAPSCRQDHTLKEVVYMAGRLVLRCLSDQAHTELRRAAATEVLLSSASGFATFGIAGTAIGTAGAASSPCLSHLTGDDGGADGPAFWRPRPSALLKGAPPAERACAA